MSANDANDGLRQSTILEEYPDLQLMVVPELPPPGEHVDSDTLRRHDEAEACNAHLKQRYVAVRHLLVKHHGVASSDFPGSPDAFPKQTTPESVKAAFVAVYSIIIAEGFLDPTLGHRGKPSTADCIVRRESEPDLRVAKQFVAATNRAVNEYKANQGLFDAVYRTLRSLGEVAYSHPSHPEVTKKSTIEIGQVSRVTRRLISQGVSSADPRLGQLIMDALVIKQPASGVPDATAQASPSGPADGKDTSTGEPIIRRPEDMTDPSTPNTTPSSSASPPVSSILEIYPDLTLRSEAEAQLPAADTKVERRYEAIRYLLTERFNLPPAELPGSAAEFPKRTTPEGVKAEFVSVFSIIQAEGFNDPTLGRGTTPGVGDILIPAGGTPEQYHLIAKPFVAAAGNAVNEYNANKTLYDAVYDKLRDIAKVPYSEINVPGIDFKSTIYLSQIAEVTRRLIENRVKSDDPQLGQYIVNALAVTLGGGVDRRASAINIDLPSLDDDVSADICPDNVYALSAIYFAAMLEDLKFFAVADKVQEQFMTGMVPLSRGPGGQAVYDYMKSAKDRLTEFERRSVYARTFGLAQGSIDEQMPNTQFSDVWIRFLSAVSGFKRQSEYQRTLVTNQQVFKSARDLAVNLSLHGFGIAHFAAVELQKLIRDVKTMLSYPDIVAAYGVRDVWQLTERVSQLYIGGSVNSVRQRTMAQSGARIMTWLGDNARTLVAGNDYGTLISNLNQGTIVDDVERWLAVTGTVDSTIEKYAEPVLVTNQPTVPQTFSLNAASDQLRNALSQMGNLGAANMPQA